MKRIAIIGAGAAGLMAAASILEYSEQHPHNPLGQGGIENIHIDIFEKNTSPGKKVIISGGGRCNVTTSITDKKILATKYTRGWEWIKKSMGRFGPKKTYEWFESHGVPLKIQPDQRVFPVSDDGRDVVGVFEEIFAKYRDSITVHYGEGVVSVIANASEASQEHNNYPLYHGLPRHFSLDQKNSSQGQIQLDSSLRSEGPRQVFHLTTPKGSYEVDALIITTGGNAYSHTGSTGDGYAFARSLGHTVTQLGPSLSSFLTQETWMHELSGLALESAQVSISEKTLTGPILFTHFGISGPLAFMLSSHLAWDELTREHPRTILFMPRSDMSQDAWDDFLKREFQTHPKKYIANILSQKLPRRLVDGFLETLFPHIREIYVSSLSRKHREDIAGVLGLGFPIVLLERRPGDEFVTAGGVSTDEIDTETMESKIKKNLYFAGEILNVDGYTGGFSLQICWSSGHVAGLSIADRMINTSNQ